MTKKVVIIAFLTFFWANKNFVHCQDSVRNYSCSQIAAQLDYYWKLDSLGTNGLRLFTYQKFIKCKIDSISVEYLLQKLGKPNRIWPINHEKKICYVYNVLDVSKMPKELDLPYSCSYVSFIFSSKTNKLILITEGDIDL